MHEWQPIDTLIASLGLLAPPICILIWKLATLTTTVNNEIDNRDKLHQGLIASIEKWEQYTRQSFHGWREEAATLQKDYRDVAEELDAKIGARFDTLKTMILRITPKDQWPES